MTALQQEDILSAVWRACDTFRGAVDATQYKDVVPPLATSASVVVSAAYEPAPIAHATSPHGFA